MISYDPKNIDKDGFPINDKGDQVPLCDEKENVVLLLKSNFFVKFKENSAIVFNHKNQRDVNKGLDTLVNVLTNDFAKHITNNVTIDFSNNSKFRFKNPPKIHLIQVYFSWIDGWLMYVGNCFGIALKLLFYSKYKGQIKNILIGLETGINQAKLNKDYLTYTKRWFKETGRNLNIEKRAKTINNGKSISNDSEKSNKTNTDLERIWFKVGLKFANGEAQELYSQYKQKKGCFNLITGKLDFEPAKKFRPYVSTTLNNTNKVSDKNIFNSRDKMLNIIDYCESNSINVVQDFYDNIPPE